MIKKKEKKYAVKSIILKEFTANKNNLEQYQNAEKIVKKLMKMNNPNVIQLYSSKICHCDVLEPLKILVQVMEYYPITLYDFVINQTPQIDWWKEFIINFTIAINQLEKEKIYHNDLTPKNIMFKDPINPIPIFIDWDLVTDDKPGRYKGDLQYFARQIADPVFEELIEYKIYREHIPVKIKHAMEEIIENNLTTNDILKI